MSAGRRTSAPAAASTPTTRGQASILLLGGLAGVLIGALVLGAVARAVREEGAAQRAADLGALAGARAMVAVFPRLFEPVTVGGLPNPRHLGRDQYVALGRAAAAGVARANGAGAASVAFPDGDSFAPVRIRVEVRNPVEVVRGRVRRSATVLASAEAELAPPGGDGFGAGGGYDGPLAYRQGEPMRPDVAQAFDRMARAARAGGIALLITSAFRTDAEQGVLFRRNPDPRWVAPPGESLHRFATELDLGPESAYGWLAAHAHAFQFIQRYANEPWHYGYSLNARSRPTVATATAGDGDRGGPLPDFVPARFAPALARAAQRWNVSATLLAAQLYAESGFNPFATSVAGAEGIAQFMPGTAAAMGLDDPFDAAESIDAQAHLMRDLLRRFAAVPLALAAYNAGPAPVQACGCVPDFPETRGYVTRVLGLMGGAGEGLGGGAPAVRLVE
jgi:hypothetical protein